MWLVALAPMIAGLTVASKRVAVPQTGIGVRESSHTFHCNTALDAPNVWQLQMPSAALEQAKLIFDEAIRPHCTQATLAQLEKQTIPCNGWHTEHGDYFIMKAGSSTDAKLAWTSDLAWISVDDQRSFDIFSKIFDNLHVREAIAPLVDTHERVRLYSSFFVVRSRCAKANLHTDWDNSVGTNAFTLLTPLADYPSADFQLLYEDFATTMGRGNAQAASGTAADESQLRQYRYKKGEAIVFASHFYHSTEPGSSVEVDGAPHVYLCFTFGTDKQEIYERTIAPTISGYQSRILVDAAGDMQLTELGRYLAADPDGHFRCPR